MVVRTMAGGVGGRPTADREREAGIPTDESHGTTVARFVRESLCQVS